MRERFALTLHGLFYRLVLGAVVLAIVVPASITGQTMWPFVIAALIVVAVGVVVGRREPHLRAWLRSR